MRKFLKQYLPDHETIRRNPWLKPFENTLLHPRLWHLNRRSAAGAVAAGLACGLIPGPLQMPGAAICAVIFKVNLPLALFVTLYTNPLTIVPLYLLAYQIGRFLLGIESGFAPPPALDLVHLQTWTVALQTWVVAAAKPLALGLITLAASFATLGYLAVKTGWRIYLLNACRQRRLRS